MDAPLTLHLDTQALADNWRALDRLSGAAQCGAAVKADGYGLGAAQVVAHLAAAGARQFYVATWAEAARVQGAAPELSVLHGVRSEDMGAALAGFARPVLNSAAQVARWRGAAGGACDVMVDTGMNRLGVSPAEVRGGLLDGLRIDTLMSHLACADEDSIEGGAINARQQARFAALVGVVTAERYSLANSAGIVLGAEYHFDLTRPGLALYGGVPRGELAGVIRPVVFPQAQILQRRLVGAGESVGYNATWIAREPTEVAILNIGYADGYFRGFSDRGHARVGEAVLPVIGRVSMDLVAVDVSAAPELAEGDWVAIDLTLLAAARASGMSQYELLTSLGSRYERVWT